jgi:hypothetical protein
MEYQIDCSPNDTGEQLKRKIEKMCQIPSDDMELFCKNSDTEDCKPTWLNETDKLISQEVVDGALVTVGVHGMRGGGDPEVVDPETGEALDDAVHNSINDKGDTSYYFGSSRKSNLTEEQRIVSGGAPQKIAEGETQTLPTTEALPSASAMFEDGAIEPGRARKAIKNYAWGDEKEVVKIYISKDSEPDAIQYAGDGKDGQIEVKYLPKALRVIVHGPQLDHMLLLDRIYYEIIPEESTFRVSANKRITLTLKKKEIFTWLKLLKPE